MDGNNLTPQEIKINELKKIFPEVFSEDKVDWEKLKATLGEDVTFKNERYVLNWAGKSEAFKSLQSPTSKTLKPVKDESVNFDNTEHIFIEGENLEVLKILQKSYFNKVKMIYIDPPYNTGNDSFIYPDKFSETLDDYQQRVGDKDEDGYLTKDGQFRKNAKENGQYHSNWLNMMYPRLFLAKNLLKQDGVIFVSIDDNEVHNLRLLMNEVFGEENFVAQLIWERAYAPKNDAKYISNSHDYILIYSKSIDNFTIGRLPRTKEANARYKNPDNDPRGVWKPSDLSVKTYSPECDYPITTPSGRVIEPPASRCWRLSKKAFFERLQDNRIWFGPDGNSVPSIKRFLTELKHDGMAPTSILFYKEVGHSQEGAKEIVSLFQGKGHFDGPKPVRLIKRLIILSKTDPNDIVLDFFSGSATTQHAVMALNAEDGGQRRCISVQLPELTDEKSEAHKAGYKTIADIAKERIRRAAKKIQDDHPDYQGDLGFKVMKLTDSHFKQWRHNPKTEEELKQQMALFVDPVKDTADSGDMVYELMLKSGLDLNASIESRHGFYLVNEGELVLILEQVSQDLIDAVLQMKPQKVIALDRLFADQDPLKTNTVLQFRDGDIPFETI